MLYSNGDKDGSFHPSLPVYGYHPTQPPEDYYTSIGNQERPDYVRLHFDENKLYKAPLNSATPLPVGIKKHNLYPQLQTQSIERQKMDNSPTRKDITQGLAKALGAALDKHEQEVKFVLAKEAAVALKKADMSAVAHGVGVALATAKPAIQHVAGMIKDKFKKDEFGNPETETDSQALGRQCPGCGESERYAHIGSLGNRDHFACHTCGIMASTPVEENKQSVDNSVRKEEKPASKEIAEVESATEKPTKGAVLPDDKKEKVIEAEGSGGKVTKKAEKKDTGPKTKKCSLCGAHAKVRQDGELVTHDKPESDAVCNGKRIIKADYAQMSVDHTQSPGPRLPGITAPPKRSAPPSPAMPTSAPIPTGGFLRKPSHPDQGTMKPKVDEAAQLKADKHAAGVGFLSGLIAKFKGIGNKGWSAPSEHSSLAGATRAMGTRMALAEKEPSKEVVDPKPAEKEPSKEVVDPKPAKKAVQGRRDVYAAETKRVQGQALRRPWQRTQKDEMGMGGGTGNDAMSMPGLDKAGLPASKPAMPKAPGAAAVAAPAAAPPAAPKTPKLPGVKAGVPSTALPGSAPKPSFKP